MSTAQRTARRKLTVLIVDDEPLAREAIRMWLADDPEIDVAGECADSESAIQKISAIRPDLIFLDVQLPGANGFEVIHTLGIEQMPAVVFVTAYDKYALQAFETQALDYLLKPYTRERFAAVLKRAKQTIHRDQREVTATKVLALLDRVNEERYAHRIVVKARGRILFVSVKDIQWFEAHGNYVRLHTRDAAHLIHTTMQDLDARLDPTVFFRIHRSYIVNIDHIQEIQSMFSRGYTVIMNNGARLVSGRGYRDKLEGLVKDNF